MPRLSPVEILFTRCSTIAKKEAQKEQDRYDKAMEEYKLITTNTRATAPNFLTELR